MSRTGTKRELKTLYDSYELYKEKAIEAGFTPRSRREYLLNAKELMKYIMSKVLDGYDVRLASSLGIIGVRGSKTKPAIGWNGTVTGVAPSWPRTKELWVQKAKELGMTLEEYKNAVPQKERGVVYCFNEHSNGIRYRIMWYKAKAIVRNKQYYSMIFSRQYKRALWKNIMEGKEYQVIAEKEEAPKKKPWLTKKRREARAQNSSSNTG